MNAKDYINEVKAFLDKSAENGGIIIKYWGSKEMECGGLSCETADMVFKDSQYDHLSIQFLNSKGRGYSINMEDGSMWGESGFNGYSLYAKVDKDFIKMLLPYYNKYYLDKWADLYKNDKVPEGVVGIHNDFFCLARQVMRGYEKGTILYKCAMPRNLLDKYDLENYRLKLFTHKIADGITVEDIILD